MKQVDPITMAVVRNNLISVANGMQETAFRCAVTTYSYEIMDCCFAILNEDTGVIAESHGMLLFLGRLGRAVKKCMDEIGNENIPGGTYTAEDALDDNGIDLDIPVPVKVAITVKGSDMTVDFTGSAPGQRGPVNWLIITTQFAVWVSIKALTVPDLPGNEGFPRPINIIAPEGTVVNSRPGVPQGNSM